MRSNLDGTATYPAHALAVAAPGDRPVAKPQASTKGKSAEESDEQGSCDIAATLQC
jgi:hypothetical protein